MIIESLNQRTNNMDCIDCVLGNAKARLSSLFGYQKLEAAAFGSLTSSCSKTGYAVTSPPPYVLSTSTSTATTSVPTCPPSCVVTYKTQAGNTCNSIALARNVSSYAVYGSNGIKDCANLLAGTQLCLLGQCKCYQVQIGDSCSGILSANNLVLDAAIFNAYNPNIDAICSNLDALIGEYICLR